MVIFQVYLMIKNKQELQMLNAHKLLIEGKYKESLSIFLCLLSKSKDCDQRCILIGLGMNYYFLKEYYKSIDYFLKAFNKSDSSDTTADYDIWEACEIIYQKISNKSVISQYYELLSLTGVIKNKPGK